MCFTCQYLGVAYLQSCNYYSVFNSTCLLIASVSNFPSFVSKLELGLMLRSFTDWEAIADRAPEELLSPNCLPGVSKLSLEDSKEDSNAQGTKRRGRGTFSYKKQGLYSDNQSDEPDTDDSENTSVHQAEDLEKRNCMSISISYWFRLSIQPLLT